MDDTIRRKGKWIPHKEISREYVGTALVSIKYDYWFCSDCGYRVEEGQPMYNFCPNCGAKMVPRTCYDNKPATREKRLFEEIVVEYLPPELCAYEEYKGKPYFSIKYILNGKEYIGYGTYNPEILSEYLIEYFFRPTLQDEPSLEAIKEYCNKRCLSIVDNALLRKYEYASVQPERKKGKWIKMSDADGYYYACDQCGENLPRYRVESPTLDNPYPLKYSIDKTNFCPCCGADMRGGEHDG